MDQRRQQGVFPTGIKQLNADSDEEQSIPRQKCDDDNLKETSRRNILIVDKKVMKER